MIICRHFVISVSDSVHSVTIHYLFYGGIEEKRMRGSSGQGGWKMKWKTLKWIMVFSSVIVLGAFVGGAASDNVEWNVYKTLQLDATPIDLAISADGRRIFVLTDQGQILVYTSTTNIEATLDVGKHVDQIKLGPGEEMLILKSSKDKTVQLVTLDFIQNINVSGAPFKGPENAAVVIAVFDDFQ
jgi:hypothetical protein